MKKLIITILLCAILLVVAIIFIVRKPAPVAPVASVAEALSVTELLSLGEKYLLDLDYEQALVQFMQVINIEPMNPRAYAGAAKSYLALGDVEKAVEVLLQGLRQPIDEVDDDEDSELEDEFITLEGEASSMSAVLLDSDVESYGIAADMTLREYVDRFGIPRKLRNTYTSWEELEADLGDKYNHFRWDDDDMISSAVFNAPYWVTRHFTLSDSSDGIFNLRIGTPFDQVVERFGIDSRAVGLLQCKDFAEALQYCLDNNLAAEITLDPGWSLDISINFENGYLVFGEDYHDYGDGSEITSERYRAIRIKNENYSIYARFRELDELDYINVGFLKNRQAARERRMAE